MNNERRAVIAGVASGLHKLDGMLAEARELASNLKAELETARDEEQDYYDNMPESFQNGDKGSQASDAISSLEQALEALEAVEEFEFDANDVESYLDSATAT